MRDSLSEQLSTPTESAPPGAPPAPRADYPSLARRSGPLGRIDIPEETWDGVPYRLLFERNPLPMWVVDTDTLEFLAVNDAALRQYGYTREEFLDRSALDLRTTDDAARLLEMPVAQEGWLALTTRHQRKDGSVFDVSLASDSIAFGGRQARLVVATDITAQTRLDAIADERDAQLRRIFESPMIGIQVAGADGVVTEANDAFLHLVGYDRADLAAGRVSWRTLTPPEYAHLDRRAQRQIEAGGVCEPYEKEVVRKDGTRTPLLVGGASGAHGTVGFALDNTERRRAARALDQSEERLRQAQKMEAVGRLAGGIAHDFTNLLTAVKSYTAILLNSLEPSDPRHGDVAAIKRAVDRAAELTSQLLAFSRRRGHAPRLVDVNTVVVEMEAMLRPLLGSDVRLDLHLAETIVGPVLADSDQLGQVLMNLALNARDAMPQGGALVIETSNVSLPAEDGSPAMAPGMYALLTVCDTGVGMDEETRARIFEPFFTTKEMGKGTGLGLSTVQGIVEQNGGTITVESEPGAGAIFRIYLPWEESLGSAELPAAAPSPDDRLTREAPGLVLLVEDDDEVRAVARRVLEEGGFTVLEARNGSAALRLYGQHARGIRLVVTDVVMPDISGRQLAERLTRRRPDLHVLYVSGHPRDELARRGLRLPATDYLPKPFSPAELMRAVRRVMD